MDIGDIERFLVDHEMHDTRDRSVLKCLDQSFDRSISGLIFFLLTSLPIAFAGSDSMSMRIFGLVAIGGLTSMFIWSAWRVDSIRMVFRRHRCSTVQELREHLEATKAVEPTGTSTDQ